MADIYADDFGKKAIPSGQRPNAYNDSYPLAKAAAASDKLYFGIIPAGTEINECSLVHDADADATLSLGFEPADGALPAANLTAWFTAQALAAAGRKESVAQPIVFQKDVKLVGSLAGGGILVGTKLTVILNGKSIGVA